MSATRPAMHPKDLLAAYYALREARRAQLASGAPLLRSFHGPLSEQVLLDFLDAQCIALHTDSLGYRHLLALPGPLWIASENTATGARPLDPAETIVYAHSCLQTVDAKQQDTLAARRARRLLWYLENGPARAGFQLSFAYFQSPENKAWALAHPNLFTQEQIDSLLRRLRRRLPGSAEPETEAIPPAPRASSVDIPGWITRAEASVHWQGNPLSARSRAELELYLAWKTTKVRFRRPLPGNREEVIAQVYTRDWRLEFTLPDQEPAGIGDGTSRILEAADFENQARPVENVMMYKEEAVFRPEEIRNAAAFLEQACRFPDGEQFAPRLHRMNRFVALLDLIDLLRAGKPWQSQETILDALASWDQPTRDAALMAELFESLAPEQFHAMIPARHLPHLQQIAQARHANRDYSQDTYGRYY